LAQEQTVFIALEVRSPRAALDLPGKNRVCYLGECMNFTRLNI